MAIIKRNIPSTETVPAMPQSDERADLLTTLTDPTPSARRWAARSLSAFPDAAHELVAHLQRETDASVRVALLTSLTEIGNTVAVAGLVECLRSEDVALRNEAIDAMRNLPDALAPIMASLLSDPDPDVRIFSVNILDSLRHPDVERWLIEVILRDAHVNVCATAVDLLGEVGTIQSRESLQALKQRFPDEPYIAFASSLALKRIQEA